MCLLEGAPCCSDPKPESCQRFRAAVIGWLATCTRSACHPQQPLQLPPTHSLVSCLAGAVRWSMGQGRSSGSSAPASASELGGAWGPGQGGTGGGR